MIIITGPGRSGTSVLAQFCLKMGYNPGGSWHDFVDAGLEHPRIAAINNALYDEAVRTGQVEQTLAQYAEEMRAFDLTVVKDPRFTFHPAILRAWHSVRPDLKVLMTYRAPEHALASRKRHARHLLHRDKAHPDVLRRDFANVIEVMLEEEIPFTMLLFPHFLNRYQAVYEAFKALGMPFAPAEGEAVWNALVNMEKVHFRAGAPKPTAEGNPVRALLALLHQPLLPTPSIPAGKRPALVLSMLIVFACAPFGWKTMGAAAGLARSTKPRAFSMMPHSDPNPAKHRRIEPTSRKNLSA